MFALQRTAISIREDVHQQPQEVRGGAEGTCKGREDLLMPVGTEVGGSFFGLIHLSLCVAVATATATPLRRPQEAPPICQSAWFGCEELSAWLQFGWSSGGVRPHKSHGECSITCSPQQQISGHPHCISLLCWLFSSPHHTNFT